MATKKQKREAAEAKRQRMLDSTRQAGLEALERDRARRARHARQVEAERQRRNASEATRILNAMFNNNHQEGEPS
jgi:hypothetical protein